MHSHESNNMEERLRVAFEPTSDAVERVIAAAMRPQQRRLTGPITAAALTLVSGALVWVYFTHKTMPVQPTENIVQPVSQKSSQFPEGPKLISKVEPIYPESARQAHISGTVTAEIAISGKGEVTDVRPIRGDPALIDSAIDAIWQWQYSPSYRNHEVIPSTATVTIIFKAETEIPISVDRLGTLRNEANGLKGDSLIPKLVQQTKNNSDIKVVLTPESGLPFRVLEGKLRYLQSQGIKNVAASGAYIFHEGRLFCLVPGLAERPQIAINMEHLSSIVRASGRLPTVMVPNSEGVPTLLYRLFLSETGEIISVQRIRGLRGPEIPDLQAELTHTTVIKPARIGSDAVSAAVEIAIPVKGIGYTVRNRVPALQQQIIQNAPYL